MIDMKKALQNIDDVIEKGPYKDTWASLSSWLTPKWYQKAKFGIFIHWGVYSVPAFESEWYPRNMYIEGSKVYEYHIKTYGAHKDFGYKDFIPMFKAEKFDPNAWAALFKKAGAKYVVPVAEHHDGFQMYRSNISHWNAYEMGPKRDIVGKLKAAVEAQGMTLGVSSHRIEHWFFMSNGKKFESDMPQNPDRDDLYWPSMPDPENFDAVDGKPSAEFMEDWLVRTCELIDNYHPKFSILTGGFSRRRQSRTSKKRRRTIIIALRNGARRLPSIINSMRTCSARRCRILSAGKWRTSSRISGRPIPPLR